MKKKSQETQESFKTRLIKLEEIYHLIQTNDEKDLEKMIALYEEGMKLARSLEKNIHEYELKIQEIEQVPETTQADADEADEPTGDAARLEVEETTEATEHKKSQSINNSIF